MSSTIVQAGNRTLDTPLRYRTGNTNDSWSKKVLATGDFNGDAKQDVLQANDHNIMFIPGRGDGTFATPIRIETSGKLRGVADFNGDGLLDLYLTGQPFQVMAGRSDGTFAVPTYTPQSGFQSNQVTVGHFNDDAFLDVAYVSTSADLLGVHFGDGLGSFTAGPTTSVSFTGWLEDLDAGDFDGNGRDDLFLVTTAQSLVAWNGGAGTFAEQTTPTTSDQGFRTSATGDINGDGLTDIVALGGNGISSPGVTAVLLGSATRNLSTTSLPGEVFYDGVTLAQMDGAGGVDLVLGSRDVTIVTHNGTGFRPSRSFVSYRAATNAVADFDGDGRNDVVTLHYEDPRQLISHLRGNGDGTLDADPSFHIITTAYDSRALAAQDLNGDSRTDLIIFNQTGPFLTLTTLDIAYADSAGGFDPPIINPITLSFPRTTTPTAGDVNGDGRIDVIFVGFDHEADTARWQPFFLQSNGTFLAGPVTIGGPSAVTLVADLTGDGRPDVLDAAGKRYTGATNGTFGPGVATDIVSRQQVEAADLNNDGRLDVATWGLSDPGNFATAFMVTWLRNSDGTFAAPKQRSQFGRIEGFADVTGDGIPELFASLSQVYRGNGDGTFSSELFMLDTLKPSLTNRPGVADFDADGKLDVARPGVIFFGTGAATFDDAAQMAAAGEVISTADFDGNGSPDVWMADRDDGRIAIIRTRRGRPSGTAPASITLETRPNPSPYGDPVRANIDIAAEESVEARGAVLLRVGDTMAIRLPDSSGNITSYVSVPMGTVNVSATFTGDAFYAPASITTTHTVEKANPWVSFSVSPTTLEMGGSVEICAYAETNSSGGEPPTGTITIRKDGVSVGTMPAANSACSSKVELTNLQPGSYTMTAEYEGDEHYLPLSKTTQLEVTRFLTNLSLTLPTAPVFAGQQATITASFPEDPGITGTVTFSWNEWSQTVAIANAQARATTILPPGSGTLTASYGGSTQFEPATASGQLSVYRSGMDTAPLLSHTTLVRSVYPYSEVQLMVPEIYGAISVQYQRSIDGRPFEPLSYTDFFAIDYVPSGQTLAYIARGRDGSGNVTPWSARVVTSTFIFTDSTLVPFSTIAKALHVSQLQNTINAYRAAAGLPLASFTPVTSGGTIAAAHLTQLRNALGEARNALGKPIVFTDPTVTPGVTRIRAVHMQELRDGVR